MDTKAVEELRFICRHQACQTRDVARLWVGTVCLWRVSYGLQDGHALQNAGHVL